MVERGTASGRSVDEMSLHLKVITKLSAVQLQDKLDRLQGQGRKKEGGRSSKRAKTGESSSTTPVSPNKSGAGTTSDTSGSSLNLTLSSSTVVSPMGTTHGTTGSASDAGDGAVVYSEAKAPSGGSSKALKSDGNATSSGIETKNEVGSSGGGEAGPGAAQDEGAVVVVEEDGDDSETLEQRVAAIPQRMRCCFNWFHTECLFAHEQYAPPFPSSFFVPRSPLSFLPYSWARTAPLLPSLPPSTLISNHRNRRDHPDHAL